MKIGTVFDILYIIIRIFQNNVICFAGYYKAEILIMKKYGIEKKNIHNTIIQKYCD